MWEKLKPYKKLIYSQVCALLAVMSLILGFMRHAQTGTWSDQIAGSFLLFAAALFIVEMRFLWIWLRENGKLGGKRI